MSEGCVDAVMEQKEVREEVSHLSEPKGQSLTVSEDVSENVTVDNVVGEESTLEESMVGGTMGADSMVCDETAADDIVMEKSSVVEENIVQETAQDEVLDDAKVENNSTEVENVLHSEKADKTKTMDEQIAIAEEKNSVEEKNEEKNNIEEEKEIESIKNSIESARSVLVNTRPVGIKTYVEGLPLTMSRVEVYRFFCRYGRVTNMDLFAKNFHGASQQCGFLTYESLYGADRAICELDGRHSFDSGTMVKMCYAQGEVERIGLSGYACEVGKDSGKLFIASIPKTMTSDEIKDMFCEYGGIEEVHVMKDGSGAPRGCAFVRFIFKEAALSAIETLHGRKTLPGCSRPMEVRFAEARRKEPINNKPVGVPRQTGGWKEYFTAEGRAYYHCESTGVTQWEKPSDMGGREGSGGPPGANIFVFHIPNEWTKADLEQSFGTFGGILSARIVTEKSTGRNKGYAFVSYGTLEAAARAVTNMNGFMVRGKKLKVSIKRGEESYVAHLLQGHPAANPDSHDSNPHYDTSARKFPDKRRDFKKSSR